MSELNYFKVSDLPVVEEVPEGATVLAYNNGELMRVSGDKLGGAGEQIVLTGKVVSGSEVVVCNYTYEEVKTMLTNGVYVGAALTVPASESEAAWYPVIQITCPVEGDIVFTFTGGIAIKYSSDGTIGV